MVTVPRDDEPPGQPGKSNDANEVTLYGPGSVRILQRGDSDACHHRTWTAAPASRLPPPGEAPAPAEGRVGREGQEQKMKLTYVASEKVMKASSRTNVASFWESVRVLNMPCDDPHRDIDLGRMLSADLPEGAMYLRSNSSASDLSKNRRRRHRAEEASDLSGDGCAGQVYVTGPGIHRPMRSPDVQ